jgi:anti-sigma factor RsiW
MSEGYASLDAHAYVDNSLSPADRAAFEAAIRRDSKLRARVEAWEAQNEAIRLAFGAAPRPRHAPPPESARPSNENQIGKTAPAPTRLEQAHPARLRAAESARAKSAQRRYEGWRLGLIGGLAFAGGMLALGAGPDDPRAALMRRATSDLRAASAFSESRLDFASNDPHAVAAWLAPRFARLDANRLAASGWSLLGVRIVPGVETAAAMVLYEDAIGGRAALLLEPSDGLPALPAICERNADETVVAGFAQGYAYAVAGPTRSGAAALAAAAAGD